MGRRDDVAAGGEGDGVGREQSVDVVEDRVTGRLRSVGVSEKLSEFGRPGLDEASEDEWRSSTAKESVEVSSAGRSETDSLRLLPKVTSVVVTTVLVSGIKMRQPF